ncbi:MAG: GNAT family N-acetyltransferase [Methanosarcinaceae archaeon]|nr:GNAT family N-acetyltransferase [Methanosarcinaceae archaeon]
MIKLAISQNGMTYYSLDHPYELDRLKIGKFTYFKKYLGMTDYVGNFKSWLKRKNVLFLIGVYKGILVGWVMAEKWSELDADGRPVYVLRAVEVSPQVTRKHIGNTLFQLLSTATVGHLITKPVNESAKKFFTNMNFKVPSKSLPVNLSNNPGYMLLLESDKMAPTLGGVDYMFDNIEDLRTKLFPGEFVSVREGFQKKRLAKDLDVSDVVRLADGKKELPGELISEHKMMSSCKCGAFGAKKYFVTGKRSGVSIVCSGCGIERYFLPQNRFK